MITTCIVLNKLNPRTPGLGHRTECREQGAPGLPLGTSLRCPTLLNSPGFSCELFEHSKPVVQLLKWPHKKREHMQPWVAEACSLYFFLMIRMMRHIFEWHPTNDMSASSPHEGKSNQSHQHGHKHHCVKTCPMDPYPFPQLDHAFCGSTISYLGWFRNCNSQDVYMLYQVQQDLGYYSMSFGTADTQKCLAKKTF